MKRQSSSNTSQTNFRHLRSMKDRDVLLTPEHPEADVKHIVRGIVRSGLKAVPPKRSVSLRIDADVLDWFKCKVRVIKRASTLFSGRSPRLPARPLDSHLDRRRLRHDAQSNQPDYH